MSPGHSYFTKVISKKTAPKMTEWYLKKWRSDFNSPSWVFSRHGRRKGGWDTKTLRGGPGLLVYLSLKPQSSGCLKSQEDTQEWTCREDLHRKNVFGVYSQDLCLGTTGTQTWGQEQTVRFRFWPWQQLPLHIHGRTGKLVTFSELGFSVLKMSW